MFVFEYLLSISDTKEEKKIMMVMMTMDQCTIQKLFHTYVLYVANIDRDMKKNIWERRDVGEGYDQSRGNGLDISLRGERFP